MPLARIQQPVWRASSPGNRARSESPFRRIFISRVRTQSSIIWMKNGIRTNAGVAVVASLLPWQDTLSLLPPHRRTRTSLSALPSSLLESYFCVLQEHRVRIEGHLPIEVHRQQSHLVRSPPIRKSFVSLPLPNKCQGKGKHLRPPLPKLLRRNLLIRNSLKLIARAEFGVGEL
jgi:hypothetical protein